METTIKKIIAGFINTDPSGIQDSTVINRSMLKSSILVHRMYGALANEGIVVSDYMSINTYDELLQRLAMNEGILTENVPFGQTEHPKGSEHDEPAIGIDIESLNSMPPTTDYREDAFYKQNFSGPEISYCILQPDAQASFAGLFAAKEAIVKADNTYKDVPFSMIEIDHNHLGKPVLNRFLISISHEGNFAIAVAISNPAHSSRVDNQFSDSLQKVMQELNLAKQKLSIQSIVSIISLLIALASLAVVFI